jgi:hypothetical protein
VGNPRIDQIDAVLRQLQRLWYDNPDATWAQIADATGGTEDDKLESTLRSLGLPKVGEAPTVPLPEAPEPDNSPVQESRPTVRRGRPQNRKADTAKVTDTHDAPRIGTPEASKAAVVVPLDIEDETSD